MLKPQMGVKRVDIIRHASGRRDLRVIRSRRREALVKRLAVEIVALVRQAHAQLAADHHDPLMRPVGLVGREQIDIRAKRADIGKSVRRIGYAVDADNRTSVMRQARDCRHIVDLANHVGTMRKTKQLGPVQQWLQVRRIEMPGLCIHLPFAHLDARLRKPPPRARVGFVILVGHHDHVALAQKPAKGLRQDIGVLGRRRAE